MSRVFELGVCANATADANIAAATATKLKLAGRILASSTPKEIARTGRSRSAIDHNIPIHYEYNLQICCRIIVACAKSAKGAVSVLRDFLKRSTRR